MDFAKSMVWKVCNFLGNKSPLHSAIIKRRNIRIGQRLIEEGADVNYYNDDDDLASPLFLACEKGQTEWICMLLYYGADPNIPHSGLLPITAILSSLRSKDREFLRYVLSPYTIDNQYLPFRTVVAAMQEETSWFCRVLENISEVVYSEEDLDFLFWSIPHIKPSNLKLLVEKFPCMCKDMSEDLVAAVFHQTVFCLPENTAKAFDFTASDLSHYKYFLDFLLYNRGIHNLCISSLLESCIVKRHSQSSVIASYVQIFGGEGFFTEEEMAERVLLMVTHGLRVTLSDLEAVYKCYGYCDLFEILLHMDVEDCCRKNISSLVLLYYDPKLTIEDCFEDHVAPLFLLDLYNDNKLKELCTHNVIVGNQSMHYTYCEFFGWYIVKYLTKEEISNKVKNMPEIPSLVELSRNVTRKHIVEKYKIRTSKDLYTVLNGLSIDKLTKDIIKLRQKLY